ncbi:MAG: M1 family metallopeptidase, partial [Bacteroidales bacterium]|nr:M1 family metallopeptidase [Bacteroidales bacterium]
MKKLLLILIALACPILIFAQHDFENLIDVKKYTINLDVSDFAGKTISGNTVVELQVLEENTSTIYLYLQKLSVDSIISSEYPVSSFSSNDTIITINFENQVPVNQDFALDIYYHGSPAKDNSGFGGFYFSGEYAFNMGCAFTDIPHNYGRTWFPCNDNFSDKALYTTKITTITGKTAISAGELVSVEPNEATGKTTFTWVLDKEIPTYLESVAVGNYYHYHSVYNGINREIPIDIYGYPGDSAKISAAFSRLDTTLRVFENHFGEYPWQRVGYVFVDFSRGAMEHVCNISLGRAYVTTGTYEELYYHELSHHWFGDLVTCEKAEEMWLNEGWATYCENLWNEFVVGEKEGRDYRRSAHRDVLTKTHISDGEYLPLSPNPVRITYSSNVYNKGASTVHTLRHYLGDELFFNATKAYLNEFSYRTANSLQYRDFLSQYTGIDLTAFFDAWVFEKGFLHFGIDSVNIEPNGDNFDITVYVRQKLLQREMFADDNKVEITFMKPDFSCETRVMEFSGEYGEQTFSLGFKPELVLCDYNEKTSDATIDETIFAREAETISFMGTDCKAVIEAIDDTAMLRVTCNFVAPDDFSEEIEGLTLVPTRYWLVESITPETFAAQLQFTYSCISLNSYEYGHIDSNLRDSLVLVFRSDKSQNWRILQAEHSKARQRFTTQSWANGEYALAMRNGYSGISMNEKSSFSVFPNPTTGMLKITFNENF